MTTDPTERDMPPEVPEKKARSEARFGTLAAAVLATAFAVAGLLLVLPLGVGNPVAAWAALFYFIAFPAAFILGIIGLVADGNKWPAILVVITVPLIMVSC